MNKSQVREALFAGLSGILLPAGFKGKKKDSALLRPTESGYQSVGFTLADYNPVFRFSVVVSLRVDAIEDLRRQFANVVPEVLDTVPTLTLGSLYFREPLGCEVRSEAEIAAAMTVLQEQFDRLILPFLDSHTSLAAVERLLNGSGDREITVALDNLAMAGVAAAALCRRPDYDDVVASHRRRISAYHEEARERFEALVAHISTLP